MQCVILGQGKKECHEDIWQHWKMACELANSIVSMLNALTDDRMWVM